MGDELDDVLGRYERERDARRTQRQENEERVAAETANAKAIRDTKILPVVREIVERLEQRGHSGEIHELSDTAVSITMTVDGATKGSSSTLKIRLERTNLAFDGGDVGGSPGSGRRASLPRDGITQDAIRAEVVKWVDETLKAALPHVAGRRSSS